MNHCQVDLVTPRACGATRCKLASPSFLGRMGLTVSQLSERRKIDAAPEQQCIQLRPAHKVHPISIGQQQGTHMQ
jgi:hypothetical protein